MIVNILKRRKYLIILGGGGSKYLATPLLKSVVLNLFATVTP